MQRRCYCHTVWKTTSGHLSADRWRKPRCNFVLAHPAVTCPIPGAKNLAQIDANAAAADGELSDDELQRIDEIAK